LSRGFPRGLAFPPSVFLLRTDTWAQAARIRAVTSHPPRDACSRPATVAAPTGLSATWGRAAEAPRARDALDTDTTLPQTAFS